MNVETQKANRRAAWRWGGFVVGLLSLQVAGGITAIILATGDESVAVVPNYHQKSLQWDDEVAVRTASQELGWDCVVAQRDSGLSLIVTDRAGEPVLVRSGELQIYRHARAADVRRVKLPANSLTTIQLPDCFDAAGLWQITIDVTDEAGNRFVNSCELNVVAPQTATANATQLTSENW